MWVRAAAAIFWAWGLLAFGSSRTSAQQAAQGPFGFFAEVIGASDRWVVIRKPNGQEYPIDLNGSVGLFLARWPTTPGRVGLDSLIEVTGNRGQNNTVLTDHVDVFRGRAQLLVRPTDQPLVDTGRPLLNPGNIMMMNIFGPVYYLPPGEINQPGWVHIVGPVINQFPLVVAQGGNVAFGIAPAGAGFTMTDVTPGSASMVKPGDNVFCFVTNWTNKSLVLDQLIVYKAMPLDQFVP